MSDRLEDLRKRYGKPWAYHDQEWALAEIDRLRANQVPGRCGECGRGNQYNDGAVWCYETRDMKDRRDFCHEWRPKE